MNDSLDLRNRILKMRESNNLIDTKKNSLNNNLMSKFESSIKNDGLINANTDKNTENYKNEEQVSKSLKNEHNNLHQYKDKYENKNLKSTFSNNDAQFLMLANKFNEAVEVILELSQKVEKLERNAVENPHKRKTWMNLLSLFSFKVLIFVLLIPIIILGFFTLPFDFSLIELIIDDVFSNI